MDDSDKPESYAAEQTPPKIKAEDNPWYFLATLYGVPEEGNDELRNKNRAAWNRYSAANLSEQTRARLIEEKPHLAEELRPFLPEEPERLQEIKAAFAKRCKDLGKNLQFPAGDSFIDFSNVEFDRDVYFDGYVFAKCSFRRASFSGKANFFSATFLGTAAFSGCTFSELTQFNSVMFYEKAYFWAAKFVGPPTFRNSIFEGTPNSAIRSSMKGSLSLTGCLGRVSSR